MGVSGLLPFVKKACRKGSIQEFSGRTLAVDVSYLLHRGVFGCAGEIANGKPTDFYVRYVRKHVDVLLGVKCHVILVFDGQPLPAKKDINDARRMTREKNNRLGHELTKQGLHTEAYRAFQQAVTITSEIVAATIRAFKSVPLVDVIVAPYEADAQIAYLVQTGLAHAAVTEDSDLIVFGCERIVFKLDLSGGCLIYEKEKLANCVCPAISRRFEFAIFRRICILAGCDYLQGGLQGVGLKKAEIFFTKTSQTDLNVILPKVPVYLNLSNVKVNKSFIEEFVKAENTFLYQVVFDVINQRHTTLNPLPGHETGDADEMAESGLATTAKDSLFEYAGKFLTPFQAVRRALGNAELSRPSALDEFVLASNPPEWSVWSGEKFLRARSMKLSQRKASAYEKLGAFAPKCSPRKVRKDMRSLLNRTFPSSSQPPPTASRSSIAMAAAKRRIPLFDIDEVVDDPDAQKSGELVVEECDEPQAEKRKCQRRSEPLEVNRAGGSSISVNPARNGCALSWNSTQWLKIYGTTAGSNESDSHSPSQSEKFRQMKMQSVAMTEKGESVSIESTPMSNSSPALNPFAKRTAPSTMPTIDGETPKKNRAPVVEEHPAERTDASHLLANLLECSPQSVEVLKKPQHSRTNAPRCSLGSQRARRPLMGLLTTTAESTSQSSSGDSQSAESQNLASSNSSASPATSQVEMTATVVMSQEVFYRRRSGSSQLLQSQQPQVTTVRDDNANTVDEEENTPITNKSDENAHGGGGVRGVTVRVSPYFLNNAKLTALAPRPTGLRAQATAFPRVL